MTGRQRHGPTEPLEQTLERGWAAFDEGDFDDALSLASTALRRHPGAPDGLLLSGACKLSLGDAAEALEDLDRAGEMSDPATFHFYRGAALYDLARVAEARTAFERTLELEPDWCCAHFELARVLDHVGDEAGARAHYRRAHEITADEHPQPLRMSDAEFDALVEEALRELSEEVRAKLEEVPVLVVPAPPDAILRAEDPPLPPDILGLFVGRSLLERSHVDLPGPPEAIYVFRRNLLRVCRDRKQLAKEVRITVQHEVGHLLGADEDRLDEWGLA